MATSAARPLARVWAAIFSCCEDALLKELDDMLTWGPAHTSWATLGSRLRSDGRPLTTIDWRANVLADAAAKHAANTHRAPAALRAHHSQMVAAHRYGAAVAGIACREANNYKVTQFDRDGNVTTLIKRDSIGRQEPLRQYIHDEADGGTLHAKPQPNHGSKPAADDICNLMEQLPPQFPWQGDALELWQTAQLLDSAWQAPGSADKHASRPAASKRRATTSAASSHAKKKQKSRASKMGADRMLAIQAAALGNAINTVANLPATDLEQSPERKASTVAKAAELTRSICAQQEPVHARGSVHIGLQPLTAVPSSPPLDECGLHSSRRQFIDSLRRVSSTPALAASKPLSNSQGNSSRLHSYSRPDGRWSDRRAPHSSQASLAANYRHQLSPAMARLLMGTKGAANAAG